MSTDVRKGSGYRHFQRRPLASSRLQKHVGVGRVSSMAAHGSGEIMLAFSTANRVPRESTKPLYSVQILKDTAVDPLYGAAIEATEEAILNALFAADTMKGVAGHTAHAIPIDQVRELLTR